MSFMAPCPFFCGQEVHSYNYDNGKNIRQKAFATFWHPFFSSYIVDLFECLKLLLVTFVDGCWQWGETIFTGKS